MRPDRRALLLAGAALTLPARAGRWDQGLLWRVTPPGGGPPSHLYGTLHVDDPAAKAFAPPLRTALAAATLFRPELRSDPLSARVFAAATRLPPGQSLRTLAGPVLFERVADLLATHYDVPPPAADRLKPWAAFLQLNQPPGVPGETVDAALERLARTRGLPVRPLESVEEQIDALETIDLQAQLALLAAQAARHAETLAAQDGLRALYLAQDLAGLARAQRDLGDDADTRRAFDQLLERLLFRRSERMARHLEDDLRGGHVLVAVGALHLQGERGLPALLAGAGHRVDVLR